VTQKNENSLLEHFLEGYPNITPELRKIIWDRVHRAQMSGDDPACWEIAHATIIEAMMLEHAEHLNTLPHKIAKKLADSFDTMQDKYARSLAAEKSAIAQRVADEAGVALREGMPRLAREFHWRVAANLFVTFMVAAIVIAGISYASGRAETGTLAAQQAELAARPDASTWIRLQAVNGNIDDIIAKNCRFGQELYVPNGTLRGACNVPLNLGGQTVPGPAGLVGQVEEQMVSTRAKMSFNAILLLGMIMGIVLLYLGRRIYDLIFER
jgi:hypothetical protein